MADSPTKTAPTTPEEFLDRTEARARQRIARATRRFGDELGDATGLKGPIRSHPYLGVAAGLVAGFFGGPPLVRHPKTSALATAGLTSVTRMVKRALEQY